MIKAAITGVHGFLPDYVLTNKELESMVDTSDEWIRTRTGITERRLLKGENRGVSELGAGAVKGLLEKTNTDPMDVEVVIFATVTADMIFPDTANTVSDIVGMKNAFGFDINAACSGFLFALSTGARYIESGKYRKVVVIGADKMSSIIDYTDRATCIIFGDGGGAVMLEPSDNGFGLEDEVLKSDGAGRHFLHMKAGGSLKPPSHQTVENKEHYVYQEGQAVFKSAVKGMANVVEDVMKRNNLTNDTVNWLVPHQANIRIIESVAGLLKFPIEKVMINIQRYGNTTAATLPLCLWEWEPLMNKGDNIILTAFGGGFTWGATYITWAID